MRTLLDTPEIEWRYVYGVMWDEEADEPHVEYTTLKEAKAVAEFFDGNAVLVARKIFTGAWAPVPVEALNDL
jgi:hypothetical protein